MIAVIATATCACTSLGTFRPNIAANIASRPTSWVDKIVEEFSRLDIPLGWAGGAPNLEPRDSIRPSDPGVVILGKEGGAELRQLPWGFTNVRGGRPVINFRSEGRRFGQGRCLVLADGFYEFTGDKSPKSKWLFTIEQRPFFAIAGLVRDERFTMLTTGPGPDIAPYHDRQIVILQRKDWRAWLDPEAPQPPLEPCPAGTFQVTQLR